jgi:hypothetical protein
MLRRVVQVGLGAAAERYARLTLRKSAQTQATYMSAYRRFAAWLALETGHPDPPPAALTADVVASYVTQLEVRRARDGEEGARGDRPARQVPARSARSTRPRS